MGRPPLPVGDHGRIDFLELGPKRIRARARYRDPDGVTRTVTRTGPTRARAERNLRAALAARTGIPGLAGTATVQQAAAEWLEQVTASDLAEQTKAQYKRFATMHIVPGLGALQLREVTVPTVDRFLRALAERRGAATAKTARSVLSSILGDAVRQGALAGNPVRDASRIRQPARPARALTSAETTDLLAKLDADPRTVQLDLPDLVRFMLATGVRLGEALALQWARADLTAGTVDIAATIIRRPGVGLIVQESTKSKAGARTLALPPSAVAMLQRRRGRVRQAADRAGYPWVTSHTFRKTVATRLDDAGLSARVIADQLGHSRPSLTQDVYMGRRVVSADAALALDSDS
ncbi:MAG: tyrosine-type recombinase/integrase [Mycobacteriales bacterium]